MTDFEIHVSDMLTMDELDRAGELHFECGPGEFVGRCAEDIVRPVLARIDRQTGRTNDPVLVASAVEDAIRDAFGVGAGPGLH